MYESDIYLSTCWVDLSSSWIFDLLFLILKQEKVNLHPQAGTQVISAIGQVNVTLVQITIPLYSFSVLSSLSLYQLLSCLFSLLFSCLSFVFSLPFLFHLVFPSVLHLLLLFLFFPLRCNTHGKFLTQVGPLHIFLVQENIPWLPKQECHPIFKYI